jgi:hypothetical protein
MSVRQLFQTGVRMKELKSGEEDILDVIGLIDWPKEKE